MLKEIKEIGGGQVELTVEIPPMEMQVFLNQAAKEISQHTKIAGFRPGKAPYDLVKKQVGEMKIYDEALEIAVSKTYVEIIKAKKLSVIGQPQIKVEKIAPGNPLVYTATVALLPSLKLPDYAQIKVSPKPIKIEEKEVSEILENLRKMKVQEKPVEREIKKDDRVDLDFDMFLNGVAIENGQHRDYPVIIGENRLVPGFEDQLIGLKAGGKKEFKLAMPQDHFDNKLAGKEIDFKVTVKTVYLRQLPELNDELAQGFGQFKSLEELKKQVWHNLEEEKKMKEEQRLEGELLDKLIKATEFSIIPDILVKSETHKMLHEFEATINRQGMQFDDYLKTISKTKEQLEGEFTKTAEDRVKSALITRQIAEEEKVEVRDDELEKETEEILASYPNNPEAIDNIRAAGYQDYLRNILATRKVMALLKEKMVEKK